MACAVVGEQSRVLLRGVAEVELLGLGAEGEGNESQDSQQE